MTPSRATSGSCGFDLCALLECETVIKPGETRLVPTGVALEIPGGFAGFVFARSGLSTRFGINLINSVGVIDNDYRGEIKVGLFNSSKADYTLKNGERIAQLVFMPVALPELIEAEVLDQSGRGAGGFGSTGK